MIMDSSCFVHQEDPALEEHRRDLIVIAARALDKARMIRFDERTGYVFSTDLGRTSSHFYIKFDTVEVSVTLIHSVHRVHTRLENLESASHIVVMNFYVKNTFMDILLELLKKPKIVWRRDTSDREVLYLGS